MSTTRTDQSMITSLTSIIMLLLMLGLIVAALWNWRSINWHEFVWLAAFLIMFAIRWPYSMESRKNTIVSDENDSTDKLLLFGMFLTMTFLPLAYLATKGWLPTFADYVLPFWGSIIGTLLIPPFLLLFWRSHADLGNNWSPGLEMHEDHKLVTRGVYTRTRHPMYSAIWLAALAQPLLIHNWIAGFAIIPAFLAMYIIRVPQEEEMMRKKFGDAYDDYIDRSGRILPKLTQASSDQF